MVWIWRELVGHAAECVQRARLEAAFAWHVGRWAVRRRAVRGAGRAPLAGRGRARWACRDRSRGGVDAAFEDREELSAERLEPGRHVRERAALHPMLGLGHGECGPAVDLFEAGDRVADRAGRFGAVAAGRRHSGCGHLDPEQEGAGAVDGVVDLLVGAVPAGQDPLLKQAAVMLASGRRLDGSASMVDSFSAVDEAMTKAWSMWPPRPLLGRPTASVVA